MNRILLTVIAILCLEVTQLFAQSAGRENFDLNWKFHLGDGSGAEKPGFQDQDWRRLDLPHDWSIEGSFRPDNPAGAEGGALPGGVGWYRKTFTISETKSLKHFITFDGVYMNSKVWINGQYLGNRPYGYATFQYDLSPWLMEGENVIAVRVDNSQQPNSRWYSGSGIYRHVWLTTTSPIHVNQWGTFVTTSKVLEKEAAVLAETSITNDTREAIKIKLVSSVIDNSGKEVARQTRSGKISAGSQFTFNNTFKITNPDLWDIAGPNLYRLVNKVVQNDQVKDTYTTTFGIRTIAFTADSGFYLNGRNTKILGVCLHHDLGSLGSAFNLRAAQRQLEILKELRETL